MAPLSWCEEPDPRRARPSAGPRWVASKLEPDSVAGQALRPRRAAGLAPGRPRSGGDLARPDLGCDTNRAATRPTRVRARETDSSPLATAGHERLRPPRARVSDPHAAPFGEFDPGVCSTGARSARPRATSPTAPEGSSSAGTSRVNGRPRLPAGKASGSGFTPPRHPRFPIRAERQLPCSTHRREAASTSEDARAQRRSNAPAPVSQVLLRRQHYVTLVGASLVSGRHQRKHERHQTHLQGDHDRFCAQGGRLQ